MSDFKARFNQAIDQLCEAGFMEQGTKNGKPYLRLLNPQFILCTQCPALSVTDYDGDKPIRGWCQLTGDHIPELYDSVHESCRHLEERRKMDQYVKSLGPRPDTGSLDWSIPSGKTEEEKAREHIQLITDVASILRRTEE